MHHKRFAFSSRNFGNFMRTLFVFVWRESQAHTPKRTVQQNVFIKKKVFFFLCLYFNHLMYHFFFFTQSKYEPETSNCLYFEEDISNNKCGNQSGLRQHRLQCATIEPQWHHESLYVWLWLSAVHLLRIPLAKWNTQAELSNESQMLSAPSPSRDAPFLSSSKV